MNRAIRERFILRIIAATLLVLCPPSHALPQGAANPGAAPGQNAQQPAAANPNVTAAISAGADAVRTAATNNGYTSSEANDLANVFTNNATLGVTTAQTNGSTTLGNWSQTEDPNETFASHVTFAVNARAGIRTNPKPKIYHGTYDEQRAQHAANVAREDAQRNAVVAAAYAAARKVEAAYNAAQSGNQTAAGQPAGADSEPGFTVPSSAPEITITIAPGEEITISSGGAAKQTANAAPEPVQMGRAGVGRAVTINGVTYLPLNPQQVALDNAFEQALAALVRKKISGPLTIVTGYNGPGVPGSPFRTATLSIYQAEALVLRQIILLAQLNQLRDAAQLSRSKFFSMTPEQQQAYVAKLRNDAAIIRTKYEKYISLKNQVNSVPGGLLSFLGITAGENEVRQKYNQFTAEVAQLRRQGKTAEADKLQASINESLYGQYRLARADYHRSLGLNPLMAVELGGVPFFQAILQNTNVEDLGKTTSDYLGRYSYVLGQQIVRFEGFRTIEDYKELAKPEYDQTDQVAIALYGEIGAQLMNGLEGWYEATEGDIEANQSLDDFVWAEAASLPVFGTPVMVIQVFRDGNDYIIALTDEENAKELAAINGWEPVITATERREAAGEKLATSAFNASTAIALKGLSKALESGENVKLEYRFRGQSGSVRLGGRTGISAGNLGGRTAGELASGTGSVEIGADGALSSEGDVVIPGDREVPRPAGDMVVGDQGETPHCANYSLADAGCALGDPFTPRELEGFAFAAAAEDPSLPRPQLVMTKNGARKWWIPRKTRVAALRRMGFKVTEETYTSLGELKALTSGGRQVVVSINTADGGAHVIRIVDVDLATGEVTYANTWKSNIPGQRGGQYRKVSFESLHLYARAKEGASPFSGYAVVIWPEPEVPPTSLGRPGITTGGLNPMPKPGAARPSTPTGSGTIRPGIGANGDSAPALPGMGALNSSSASKGVPPQPQTEDNGRPARTVASITTQNGFTITQYADGGVMISKEFAHLYFDPTTQPGMNNYTLVGPGGANIDSGFLPPGTTTNQLIDVFDKGEEKHANFVASQNQATPDSSGDTGTGNTKLEFGQIPEEKNDAPANTENNPAKSKDEEKKPNDQQSNSTSSLSNKPGVNVASLPRSHGKVDFPPLANGYQSQPLDDGGLLVQNPYGEIYYYFLDSNQTLQIEAVTTQANNVSSATLGGSGGNENVALSSGPSLNTLNTASVPVAAPAFNFLPAAVNTAGEATKTGPEQDVVLVGTAVTSGPATPGGYPELAPHPVSRRNHSATARLKSVAYSTGDSLSKFPAPRQRTASGGQKLSDAISSAQAIYSIVANGKSSGKAMELQVYDPSGRMQDPQPPDGMVLEPVEPGAAKSVEELKPGARIIRKTLTAYCVDYQKPPPEAGLLYRIAPPEVQARYGDLASTAQAGRELAEEGAFTPDSNPETYRNFIQQYSLWAKIQGWTQQQFASVFLEKIKATAAASHGQWTPQMDQSIMALVPGRWRDILLVQKRAAEIANRKQKPNSANQP